jgi:ABC-type transport system involved in cytochrome bd biosynthesis fused ATPase/permease subunit
MSPAAASTESSTTTATGKDLPEIVATVSVNGEVISIDTLAASATQKAAKSAAKSAAAVASKPKAKAKAKAKSPAKAKEAKPAQDLEAAALVDGASRMEAFIDVILPQAIPGIISTALFTFILAWNEYLYALVLVNTDEARPLTTGVMNMLITAFNIEWSLLMAASVMMSLPVIIVFALLQKHLTRGFGAGGVKG